MKKIILIFIFSICVLVSYSQTHAGSFLEQVDSVREQSANNINQTVIISDEQIPRFQLSPKKNMEKINGRTLSIEYEAFLKQPVPNTIEISVSPKKFEFVQDRIFSPSNTLTAPLASITTSMADSNPVSSLTDHLSTSSATGVTTTNTNTFTYTASETSFLVSD
ncbi:MAG: hypothetical protein HQM10_21640 [Candidatus Riflebacteria bacterium]|nr:hypothetical protein [Candidatus Riflebacteria bacterium]